MDTIAPDKRPRIGAQPPLRTEPQALEQRLLRLEAELAAARVGRRRAESALARLRAAVDHAGESMFLVGDDGRVLDANSEALRRYGIDREVPAPASLVTFEAGACNPGFTALGPTLTRDRTVAYETVHRPPAGDEFPVSVVVTRLDDDEAVYCVWTRDLSERNRARAALGDSDGRLRAFLEHLPAGVNMKDRDGHFMLTNRVFQSWFGLAAGEGRDKTSYDLLDRESAELNVHADRRVFETGQVVQWEHAVRTGDGVERTFAVSKFPIRGADGEVMAAGSIGVDISRTKAFERALRESEQRFDRAVRGSSDGLWDRTDMDCDAMWWSPRLYELLGFRPGELEPTTTTFLERLHPQDRPGLLSALDRHLTARARFDVEFRLARRDGGYGWYRCRGQAQWDETGRPTGISGSLQDIAGLKLAEQRKLDAVCAQRDALVREVHHRIKNHLQGILGLLTQLGAQAPEMVEVAGRIRAQIGSIAIVHGLQSESREDILQLGRVISAILDATRTAHASRPFEGPGQDVLHDVFHGMSLCDSEAVPVALVLNELFTNAFKHARPGPGARAQVRVEPRRGAAGAWLRIENLGGPLPAGFDFAGGAGLGTGLGLVRSLLPPEGVRVRFESVGHRVRVEVHITAPAVLGACEAPPETTAGART